jgi:hypothetical protein
MACRGLRLVSGCEGQPAAVRGHSVSCTTPFGHVVKDQIALVRVALVRVGLVRLALRRRRRDPHRAADLHDLELTARHEHLEGAASDREAAFRCWARVCARTLRIGARVRRVWSVMTRHRADRTVSPDHVHGTLAASNWSAPLDQPCNSTSGTRFG